MSEKEGESEALIWKGPRWGKVKISFAETRRRLFEKGHRGKYDSDPSITEKLYGLTSWLIPWIALKITLKVTPSQYTQVPMYSLVFLFGVSSVEVDVPYLTSLDCHCDLSRRLSPNILWCVLIDQLILILGCNRLNRYGKFVRSTTPPGHVMVSGGGSPTGVCVWVCMPLYPSRCRFGAHFQIVSAALIQCLLFTWDSQPRSGWATSKEEDQLVCQDKSWDVRWRSLRNSAVTVEPCQLSWRLWSEKKLIWERRQINPIKIIWLLSFGKKWLTNDIVRKKMLLFIFC